MTIDNLVLHSKDHLRHSFIREWLIHIQPVSREDKTRNGLLNAKQDYRLSSQVSFQTAHVKRDLWWPSIILFCIPKTISSLIFPGNRLYMNQSFAYEWVTPHMNASCHPTRCRRDEDTRADAIHNPVMSHINEWRHIWMHQSFHVWMSDTIYECVMSPDQCARETRTQVLTLYIIQSCHIWMSDITYECVMSPN